MSRPHASFGHPQLNKSLNLKRDVMLLRLFFTREFGVGSPPGSPRALRGSPWNTVIYNVFGGVAERARRARGELAESPVSGGAQNATKTNLFCTGRGEIALRRGEIAESTCDVGTCAELDFRHPHTAR